MSTETIRLIQNSTRNQENNFQLYQKLVGLILQGVLVPIDNDY